MFNPIKKTKVADVIIEQLKEKIKNKEFPPDTKLPSENELAKMFGVSRAPIREAISVLAAGGLVESVQGGGNYVKKVPTEDLLDTVVYEMITEEEVYDLLELRTVIETEAAALAAERRTEEELKAIRQALEQFAETVNDEMAVGDESDFTFHMTIVRAAHNAFLTQSVENVRDLFQKALTYSLKKNIGRKRKREQVYQEHINIYEAIKKQDKEAAAHYMKQHLLNARLKLGDSRVKIEE